MEKVSGLFERKFEKELLAQQANRTSELLPQPSMPRQHLPGEYINIVVKKLSDGVPLSQGEQQALYQYGAKTAQKEGSMKSAGTGYPSNYSRSPNKPPQRMPPRQQNPAPVGGIENMPLPAPSQARVPPNSRQKPESEFPIRSAQLNKTAAKCELFMQKMRKEAWGIGFGGNTGSNMNRTQEMANQLNGTSDGTSSLTRMDGSHFLNVLKGGDPAGARAPVSGASGATGGRFNAAMGGVRDFMRHPFGMGRPGANTGGGVVKASQLNKTASALARAVLDRRR